MPLSMSWLEYRTESYGTLSTLNCTIFKPFEAKNLWFWCCTTGQGILTLVRFTVQQRASIWDSVRVECGGTPTTSQWKLRTRIATTTKLRTVRSKCSAHVWWLETAWNASQTAQCSFLLHMQIRLINMTVSRGTLEVLMFTWCTPTSRHILSTWLHTVIERPHLISIYYSNRAL